MRVNAGGQEVEQIEPFGIGDGQVVAHTANLTETEDGAGSAFAFFFSSPPPEVFGMNQPQRAFRWSLLELAGQHSIAISLQNHRFLIYIVVKKLDVGHWVETANQAPGAARYIYIFRMAAGAALLAEFGLEYIQERDFLPIGIARFFSSHATGSLFANKPHPLLCDKANSGDATMVVLVRVGKTENPVETHGVGLTFKLKIKDDGLLHLASVVVNIRVPDGGDSAPPWARCRAGQFSF